DYILVTHAHTDHTGALPLILEQYPSVPVIMTRPTEALTRTLQKDAQRIMKSRYEEEGELPIFDSVAVDALMNAIQHVEFRRPLKLGDSLQVTYHISGHIAGAAMLVIESSEGTLVMSGDVSISPQRTVESLQLPRIKADALVLESTYGGRLHAERRGEELRLVETLKRVTERGGKVLIPAFALGRAQEVIQIIHAYRNELDVSVYVDGMVRKVCESYARFGDLIPKATSRMAGEDDLFYRNKVKAIKSRQQRDMVGQSAEPLIVVASSGMLTGGASVAYAKHFAPDERNAILLTGYQDEEAPGRFLQNIMKKRQAGDIPTLKFDDDVVKVRCEVGTYSLSAHADEQELVNIALALKPKEVMLVHGDHGARHSIATALRRRDITTSTPKIGTVKQFKFRKKPWAVGAQVESGKNIGDVDIAKMWQSLKSQAGDFFSSRELAQVWWGEGERAREMSDALEHQDNIYFSADWRNRRTFKINSPEQVARSKRQREIMLRYPDLIGKLVVLRNSNNQPRVGVVTKADIDSFDANVASAKGSHYPADALLWVVGTWTRPEDAEGGTKKLLNNMLKLAKGHADTLVPFTMRQQLVQEELTVLPEMLMPDTLPEGVDRQTALVGIVLALAADGATLEEDGLKPQRAMENEPLDQNDARAIAISTFPDDARLRKVGMEIHRKRLTLNFDFPQSAERRYKEEIESLIEATGWDVQVKQSVNQQALSEMVAI
ncbi:MAG: MBL fold metallo-hydrolase, partial [Aggregatilineales bacterium]